VFPAGNGSALNPANLRRDALRVPREEANLTWVGFHTFRHTCASMLFAGDVANGVKAKNAVQVQRWLGHHSPAFTLERYVHLLDDDLGDALSIPQGVKGRGRTRAHTGARSATLERTQTPGVYRRGRHHVVAYREDGRQRWRTFPTYEAACGFKRDIVLPQMER